MKGVEGYSRELEEAAITEDTYEFNPTGNRKSLLGILIS